MTQVVYRGNVEHLRGHLGSSQPRPKIMLSQASNKYLPYMNAHASIGSLFHTRNGRALALPLTPENDAVAMHGDVMEKRGNTCLHRIERPPQCAGVLVRLRHSCCFARAPCMGVHRRLAGTSATLRHAPGGDEHVAGALHLAAAYRRRCASL